MVESNMSSKFTSGRGHLPIASPFPSAWPALLYLSGYSRPGPRDQGALHAVEGHVHSPVPRDHRGMRYSPAQSNQSHPHDQSRFQDEQAGLPCNEDLVVIRGVSPVFVARLTSMPSCASRSLRNLVSL
ncbi:hypothetical protein BDW68DRAFT_144699 [Aspergillus falconensis]